MASQDPFKKDEGWQHGHVPTFLEILSSGLHGKVRMLLAGWPADCTVGEPPRSQEPEQWPVPLPGLLVQHWSHGNLSVPPFFQKGTLQPLLCCKRGSRNRWDSVQALLLLFWMISKRTKKVAYGLWGVARILLHQSETLLKKPKSWSQCGHVTVSRSYQDALRCTERYLTSYWILPGVWWHLGEGC